MRLMFAFLYLQVAKNNNDNQTFVLKNKRQYCIKRNDSRGTVYNV